MNDKSALIIGAGPAGLTAAYELLHQTDITPIVVEADSVVGGLARTINHNGNRIDIGGHRFFSKSDRVMEWWLNILPIEDTSKHSFKNDLIITYQNQNRIVKRDATVRVFLHHRGMQLKEIPVKELAIFFVGEGTANLFDIESKVEMSVGKYIDELSKLHEVHECYDDLHIRISTSEFKVIVSAYNHLQFIKNISVKELVKYFKP